MTQTVCLVASQRSKGRGGFFSFPLTAFVAKKALVESTFAEFGTFNGFKWLFDYGLFTAAVLRYLVFLSLSFSFLAWMGRKNSQ